MLRNKRGSVESINYFLIVGVVVAALIGMQVFVKRGMQGRINKTMDQVSGEGAYAPGATIGAIRVDKKVNEEAYSRGSGLAGEDERFSKTQSLTQQATQRYEETEPYLGR